MLDACFIADKRWPQAARAAQSNVLWAAEMWSNVGAAIGIDLGTTDKPRICEHKTMALFPVRIMFNDQHINGSLVGSEAKKKQPLRGGGTMSLAIETARSPAAEERGRILHEFGHALGLIHEFQRPEPAGCADSFQMDQAIEYFRSENRWDETETRRQLEPLSSGRSADSGVLDRKSIMMYALPGHILDDGAADECFLERRSTQLSDGDREVLRNAYPPVEPPRKAKRRK